MWNGLLILKHQTNNLKGGWLCFPFAVKEPIFTVGRLGGPVNPATDIIQGTNRILMAVNSGVSITQADKSGVALSPMDSPLISHGRTRLMEVFFGS